MRGEADWVFRLRMMEYAMPRYIGFHTEWDKKWDEEKIDPKSLLIIAPPHKLYTAGKEVIGHIATIVIKDPIVLQPVNFGYIIVSSWGLEASDELVVNEINN